MVIKRLQKVNDWVLDPTFNIGKKKYRALPSSKLIIGKVLLVIVLALIAILVVEMISPEFAELFRNGLGIFVLAWAIYSFARSIGAKADN